MQRTLTALLTLLITATLYAEDYEDMFDESGRNQRTADSAGMSAPARPGIELAGEHAATLSLPAYESGNTFTGSMKAPQVRNALTLSARKGRVSLQAGADLRMELTSSGQWTDIVRLLPLENSISIANDVMRATLGYQYYSWGSADRLNPTDNLNPRDYTSGPDPKKIPLFSLSTTLYSKRWLSVQGVYAPFEQSDAFPLSAVEEVPDDLFSTVRFAEVSATPEGIVTTPRVAAGTPEIVEDSPAFQPSSFIAGGRARIMSNVIDLSASYLYDYDSYFTPRITLRPYAFVDEHTTFAPYIPDSTRQAVSAMHGWRLDRLELYRGRMHRIGLDVKKILGRVGVWGEACYSLTEDRGNDDPAVRNDMLSWTAGLDISYGPGDEHYVNIQHVGQFIVDYDDSIEHDYPGGAPDDRFLSDRSYMERYYARLLAQSLARQSEGLLLGGTLRADWSFADGRLKPSVEAVVLVPLLYDSTTCTRYADAIGRVCLDWLPHDVVTVSLGCELFYSACTRTGEDTFRNFNESLVGSYYPHSRMVFECTYAWAQ